MASVLDGPSLQRHLTLQTSVTVEVHSCIQMRANSRFKQVL